MDSRITEGPGPESDQDRVTVGIRASDIILANEELSGSSARNRLQGEVIAVESRPPGYAVTLKLSSNLDAEMLRSHIIGAALDEMGIRVGQQLWAVFKASSCFLVNEEQSTESSTD